MIKYQYEKDGFIRYIDMNEDIQRVSGAESRRAIAVRLGESATAPRRSNATDAGADLTSAQADFVLEPGESALVDTQVHVKIPAGYAGFVYNRSGQGAKGIIVLNSVGVIDSDYRGPIKVALYNLSEVPFAVAKGQRIAQLVIQKVELIDFIDIWNDTERGTGGFGSTGK